MTFPLNSNNSSSVTPRSRRNRLFDMITSAQSSGSTRNITDHNITIETGADSYLMADDAMLSEDSTGDGMRIQSIYSEDFVSVQQHGDVEGSPGSHNVDADNYGADGEQMIISDDPMHQFASALSDRVRVSRSRATSERNQSEDNGSTRYNGRQFTRLTANVSMDNANIFYRFCNPELQEIVLR